MKNNCGTRLLQATAGPHWSAILTIMTAAEKDPSLPFRLAACGVLQAVFFFGFILTLGGGCDATGTFISVLRRLQWPYFL
jgi:hypothetical protein